MDCWKKLGISRTADKREIKRAYAKLIKVNNPEDHPQEYQAIREAYDRALALADDLQGADPAQYASPDSRQSTASQPEGAGDQDWATQSESETDGRRAPPGGPRVRDKSRVYALQIETINAVLAKLIPLLQKDEVAAMQLFRETLKEDFYQALDVRYEFEGQLIVALLNTEFYSFAFHELMAREFKWDIDVQRKGAKVHSHFDRDEKYGGAFYAVIRPYYFDLIRRALRVKLRTKFPAIAVEQLAQLENILLAETPESELASYCKNSQHQEFIRSAYRFLAESDLVSPSSSVIPAKTLRWLFGRRIVHAIDQQAPSVVVPPETKSSENRFYYWIAALLLMGLVRALTNSGGDRQSEYRSLDRSTYNQSTSSQNQFNTSPSSENPLDPSNLDFRKLNPREFNRANQDCSGSLRVQSNGQQGNCMSSAPIADIYAFPKERMERIWTLQREAESGDAEAQYTLGMEFLSGDSALSKDPRKGYEWLARAANQKHILASEALGIAYLKGEVGSTDDKLAVDLLTFAADRDRADAKYWLALAYSQGRGVEVDTRLAAQLIDEAAALGSVEAAHAKKAGTILMPAQSRRSEAPSRRDEDARRIVPPSFLGAQRRDEAVAYLQARAVTGNADATYQLAMEYLSGKRVAKDYEQASIWLEKLGEKNAPVANFWLSQLYQKGLGVPQDKARGRALLADATLQANPKMVKDFAWQIATHSNKELRNGHLAVELMEKELQNPANNNVLMLNTLAAAYASVGNFEKAVQSQKSAVELLAAAGNGDQRSELESRLNLYRNSEAYVEK